MKQVASLQYGVIFKKAFCQLDVFTAFVKDILGIDLEIDQVETEKSFKPTIGKVDTRFDLFAEDKKNRIIVDIQHDKFPDHYDRFLHYHCVALLEQIANSQDYAPKLRVFTIVVLTSGDKHKTDILTIDFDPKKRNGEGVKEIPHKVVYLCPKYVSENTPEPYREWLQAINDSLDEQVEETAYQRPAIQRVFDLIEQDTISPTERAKMKDEYGFEQIIRGKYEEGQYQAQCRITRHLLTMGMDLTVIAQATGLTIQQIEQVAKDGPAQF